MNTPPAKTKLLTPQRLARLEESVRNIHTAPGPGVAAIVEFFEAPPHRGRRELLLKLQALNATCLLGPKAQAAVHALKGVLNAGNAHTRELAAMALAEIGPHKVALPELIRQLHSPSYSVRGNTALALGRFGKEGVSAAPALAMALQTDIFRTVRANIASALGEISSLLALSILRRAIRIILLSGGQNGKR